MMRRFLTLAAVSLLLPSGCSMTRMAVGTTAKVMRNARPAFEREWDYELAAASLPGNVKMVEGFLQSDPGNPDLLQMSAMSYTSLGLVVLEDQLQQLDDTTDEADRLRRRIKEMYLRGHRYGLRLIDVTEHRFSAAFAKGGDALKAALAECDEEDVAGLLWTALPLASALNIARDDIVLIAEMPKLKLLIQRLIKLDERAFNAAPQMVYGSMLGGLSKAVGGDPEAGKKHLERALTLTKRRFLLIHVNYAKSVAVQLQDKKLFLSLLSEVIEAKLDIFPEQKLANVVAKRRARRLIKRVDELFD